MIATLNFPTLLHFPRDEKLITPRSKSWRENVARMFRAPMGNGVFAQPMGGVVSATSWLPSDISGLIGWESDYGTYQERTGASATTPAAASNDPVGTWKSKYGTTTYYTTNADSKRPTLQTNQLNALPILRADGSDDFLQVGTGYPTNFCIIVVLKKAAAGSTQMIMSSNYAAGDGQTYYTAADKLHPLGATSTNTFTVTNWNIIQFARTGTSGVIRFNGGAGDNKTFDTNTDSTLSLFASSDGSSFRLAADAAAVYICNTDISLTDLNLLGAYINTKFGITWNTAS